MTEEIPTEMNVFIPPVPPPPPPTAPSALPSEQLLTSSSTAIPAKSLTHLPKRPPVDIEFSDITYTVPTAKGSKLILRNLNGLFRSGHLTAILGPSGSGKSTLLNVLAGYKSVGCGGTILTNGQPRDMGLFRKISRYIMQEDIIQHNLTVEECMIISANLKLGKSRNKEEKLVAVNEILDILRLNNCRKTWTTKLSGGEKKRLSIALELVNNPPVIFLDEPTTGLDDLSSSQCISLLKVLAMGGRTIVCSIHTPSARLFSMFDHVYIVAHGYCVFQGCVNDIVPFLQTFGFNCPTHYNPADFIMEVSSGEYGNYIDKMVAAVDNGKIYKWMNPNGDKSEPLPTSRLTPIQNNKKDYNFDSSGWLQFRILFKRMLLQLLRDYKYLLLKVILYIFVAFLVGGMFFQMGNDASKTLFNLGFCFVTLIALLYFPMMPVLLQFPSEVQLLKREYFNRWYGLTSYFFAMSFSRLPIQLLLPSIYTIIVYILTNQPLELYRYLWFWCISLIVAVTSESFALVLSSSLSVVNGIFTGPALSVPLMLLAVYGLGYGSANTPVYMKLFMSLSYLRYGLEGLVTAIYGGNRPNLICPAEDIYCHYRNPKTIIDLAGMENASLWYDVTALFGIAFTFRIACFLLLRYRLSKNKKFTALHRISRIIKANFDLTRKYS
ncbi:ABC transporter, putative [Pediculus humanus corporis]|uniref:ABC transporter, putative n=1 Tax=Pediculus humanus subsp. corporis TaxID=121224 RepID=E0VFB5_PEDHC|nr:ABC transporter, putative [Pediculus humanus corporis]EEB12071.1 ABC transporter, putative [Pediculus humanus corporis]